MKSLNLFWRGRRLINSACVAVFFMAPTASASPTVRFETVLGDIDMELLDQNAPLTVANFLNYVTSERYFNSFFHRSVPDFIVQGGGFTFPSDLIGSPINIPEDDPVPNEPGASNIRGTVAMAKLGSDPNSATSEFFFNLVDNSQNLDNQNGGFTVFGQVDEDSMQVVDAIAALPRVNAGGAFTTLPVINFSGNTIRKQHLTIVTDVYVLGGSVIQPLPGDFNNSGSIEQGDLDLVLLNWGASATPIPDGWINDLPNGNVDQNELDKVLLGWGNSATVAAMSAVPEPGSWFLFALSFFLAVVYART